ncbi:MAG: right-handed parallel beta-helix repeat-containing protein, partial [Prevotella sp.]|nr:right-handed parallel beta-helix repeat-containing protein [Prevotella sp.]
MKFRNIILLLFATIVSLTSCSDDESFTLSPSRLLTFSADSIQLDTLFSNVPSRTKDFWVYNRSGEGIRCTNIRLERGNQSGFRVNVDGSYLGAAVGFQTSNVELRNKDSIRIFVEATTPYNHQDKPQLVEDNLLFTLESGVTQKVNLNA